MNDSKVDAAYHPNQPPGDTMTTNQERAAEVIGEWIDNNLPHSEQNFGADEGISEALADDDLITPDLPRPDRDGRWWPAAVSISNVSINPAGEVVLHSGNFRDMQLHLTPEKANDLADILKAAAVHATQEKK